MLKIDSDLCSLKGACKSVLSPIKLHGNQYGEKKRVRVWEIMSKTQRIVLSKVNFEKPQPPHTELKPFGETSNGQKKPCEQFQ